MAQKIRKATATGRKAFFQPPIMKNAAVMNTKAMGNKMAFAS